MASFHARSNSLPSRPHPIVSEVEEIMNRLSDSQAATSTSSSSLNKNLSSLQDLHDCVDKLLLLPLTQQVLAREDNRNQVDELLDGSLRILDLCNITKDVLLQSKDCIQQLQSVFRRKQGSFETEIKKYMSSRKIVKKTIKKAFKNLKSNENKSVSSDEILTMMREVESITLNAFESFLSYISESSKPSGWSLVSRLMRHKRVATFSDEQEANQSEFAMVDAALESLVGSKSGKSDEAQKKLHSLELCIQDLEDGVECLFRKLIKSRASFLNILN